MPTDAVQPETSSSYLGSATQFSASDPDLRMTGRTTQDSSVGGEEAVLERLLVIVLFKGLLSCHDLVEVLASEDGDLVSSMSVVYAKEADPCLLISGRAGFFAVGLQVQDASMRILHAYPPSLHRRDTIYNSVVLTAVRSLQGEISA